MSQINHRDPSRGATHPGSPSDTASTLDPTLVVGTVDRPVFYIAFRDHRRLAKGPIHDVAQAIKEASDRPDSGQILILDATTSRPVELDLRGNLEEVLGRLPALEPASARDSEDDPDSPPVRRGPGRPKLGVVGREVTLLPRHWRWLSQQPGSASVTLRKLVDRARKESAEKEQARRALDSAYRFTSVLAGNLPGFEEATRALYAGRIEDFRDHSADWPADIRDHARSLAEAALGRPRSSSKAGQNA